ncbi:MAG: hypothetical protein IAA73_09265 [Bacteroidetes bacterium]|uniref:Uncharacterized protein n=1 Tax=Candidatus Gallipaludibacter merdavium TaxID=2840839 RepID=A0A9D9HUN5_9BACT|nr:hypothetical protein [Candidatus Gallipaludibacter merdavium]
MSSSSRSPKLPRRPAVRVHRHTFMLNEQEERALERYCRRYRISNKSKFIREAVINVILRRFDEDHPTLF